MARGLSRPPRPTVPLEEGAEPGGARCPACDEPMFVWLETEGWGPREDQVVYRCERCGLVAPAEHIPGSPEEATRELLARARREGDALVVRSANAASLQAWLGAENWAALRPADRSIKLTPRAAALLLEREGFELTRVRYRTAAGMATMWQTLLNLLTFHRDFAAEASSRRLRPGSGRGRAAYAVDAAITVLAAIPTAALAVVLEGAATLFRRGGAIEVRARPARG